MRTSERTPIVLISLAVGWRGASDRRLFWRKLMFDSAQSWVISICTIPSQYPCACPFIFSEVVQFLLSYHKIIRYTAEKQKRFVDVITANVRSQPTLRLSSMIVAKRDLTSGLS